MKKHKKYLLSSLFLFIGTGIFAQITSTIEKELTTPWYGFGYNQWGHACMNDGVTFKPWDESSWNITEQRILALQPSLVRLPLMREWFNQTDEGENLPIGTYNWEGKYMQAFYKSMDLYKKNNIAVLSGLWHSGYDPQGREPVDFYITKGEGSFAHLQADLIDHLMNVKGYTNIAFYTPTNEPLGSISDFNVWKTMIKNLHEELTARSLPTDILIGADSWGDWTWLPARENSNELVGYDFHHYLNDTPDDTYNHLYNRSLENNLKNSVNRIYQEDNTNKPVMVTEVAPIGVGYIDWPVSDAPVHCRIDTYEYGLNFMEYGIQLLRSGAASGLAWGLDGFDQNKNAGMWNNSGSYGGMLLRPWYYTWQLMCRYFPSQATILEMKEAAGSNDIRIAGAKIGADDYTFAITNRRTSVSSNMQKVTLKAPAGAKTFYVYHYSRENYGNGAGLTLPYHTITTDNLSEEGVTIEIRLETAVLLTTLPPHETQGQKTALIPNLDFETSEGYLLSSLPYQGVSGERLTNPRKAEPNTSDYVLRILQKMPSDLIYNPDNASLTVTLDELFEISAENHTLTFHAYKNGTDTEFIVGVKTENETEIYGNTFITVNRKWEEYALDLYALQGKKISSFHIFPNIHFSNNSLTEESSLYIDNIHLSSGDKEGKETILIENSSSSFLFTSVCNITFEHKEVNIMLTASANGSVSVQSNPQKQDENDSGKSCKITFPTSGNGNNPENFYIAINPFPYILITEKQPYLNFQVLRSSILPDGMIVIKLKDKEESVSTRFIVDVRRKWKDFSVDLSAYADEIIENIFLYPNVNTPVQDTDECYFDNIRLEEKQSTSSINRYTEKQHTYFIRDRRLTILDAEGENLTIYTPDGKQVQHTRIDSSTYETNLVQGIYIITIGNKHYKIII